MKGDKFTVTPVSSNASKSSPLRIKLDGSRIMSVSIINTANSVGNLMVGVNDDSVIIPLEPGDSLPLAGRDDAYLTGFILVYWDEAATTKQARIITGKDEGEIKDC